MVSVGNWDVYTWPARVVDQLGSAHRLQRIDDRHRYTPLLSCTSLKVLRKKTPAYVLRKTILSWRCTESFIPCFNYFDMVIKLGMGKGSKKKPMTKKERAEKRKKRKEKHSK